MNRRTVTMVLTSMLAVGILLNISQAAALPF